jgi:hypothetical protein
VARDNGLDEPMPLAAEKVRIWKVSLLPLLSLLSPLRPLFLKTLSQSACASAPPFRITAGWFVRRTLVAWFRFLVVDLSFVGGENWKTVYNVA